MIHLADKEHCTGCGACAAVCPVQSITMKQSDLDGFYRPNINRDICIKCGRCESICPELHRQEKQQKQYYGRVYAAVHKEEKIRYDYCTSGGVYAALAYGVINRGGCVVGAAYNEDWKVVHLLVDSADKLKPLFGSKYLQSDISHIYTKIEQKLAEGKEVLFCGTPCQIMAVKRYAEAKKLEKKLITVELLCRGVPSPKAFDKYLEAIEKKFNKKIVFIRFKDKEKGWHNVGTRIVMQDNSEYYEIGQQSEFVKAFLEDNITVRESCLYCAYKKIDRQGDIIIGDFWGLKHTKLEDDKGTSAVILNSEKGTMLWEEIKQMLEYKESTLWRVVKGNRMAFDKLPQNPARQQFWEYLKEYDFEEALKKVRTLGSCCE